MLVDALAGLAIGIASGFTSGLMGVSPGGGLVVFSALILGAGQHVAQGLSLAAQIPPVSLPALKRYRDGGSQSPWRWLAPIGVGSIVGGVIGAVAAGGVSGTALRWVYVGYLLTLAALLRARSKNGDKFEATGPAKEPARLALLALGLAAGLSSGFLGIGGGLATTVGLTALLRVPQRQSQMVSLALTLMPMTLPSAWVYGRDGFLPSWSTLAGVVVELILGTDLGARAAQRLSQRALRRALLAFVAAMVMFMAFSALTGRA